MRAVRSQPCPEALGFRAQHRHLAPVLVLEVEHETGKPVEWRPRTRCPPSARRLVTPTPLTALHTWPKRIIALLPSCQEQGPGPPQVLQCHTGLALLGLWTPPPGRLQLSASLSRGFGICRQSGRPSLHTLPCPASRTRLPAGGAQRLAPEEERTGQPGAGDHEGAQLRGSGLWPRITTVRSLREQGGDAGGEGRWPAAWPGGAGQERRPGEVGSWIAQAEGGRSGGRPAARDPGRGGSLVVLAPCQGTVVFLSQGHRPGPAVGWAAAGHFVPEGHWLGRTFSRPVGHSGQVLGAVTLRCGHTGADTQCHTPAHMFTRGWPAPVVCRVAATLATLLPALLQIGCPSWARSFLPVLVTLST